MAVINLFVELYRMDEELKGWGVPLRNRPLEVFKKLHGSVRDDDQRSVLFSPIIDWYIATYGEEARWNGVLGRFPVIIRGGLYVGRVVVSSDHRPCATLDQIEDLSEEIKHSINVDEFRDIAERLGEAAAHHSSLYNLNLDDHFLSEEARNLFHMGLRDLDSATSLLKHSQNPQGSIVASHEAAEKFLKIALLRSRSNKKPRSFQHDIPKLFKELVKLEPRYGWLVKPTLNIQRLSPDMEMRYKLMQRSQANAVSAFNATLYVCGVLANIWLYDELRGSKPSAFTAGKFYKNSHGNAFYCKTISGDTVTLINFKSDPIVGCRRTDITTNRLQSALYLEVDDPIEDNRLREELMMILRAPLRLVTPEEANIRMVNGDEGSYNTMMVRVKAQNHPVAQ
jgi:HEPN domain-containing protein